MIGEACTVEVTGTCVPSGKCPIFKGATVCVPKDARPPPFVLEACANKQDGDECSSYKGAGHCHKLNYINATVCRPDTGLPVMGAVFRAMDLFHEAKQFVADSLSPTTDSSVVV
uniref:Uncharacterized protein n=2 Tax=Oxyrrhis marina TaxID=2969 RepID=A0A7S3XH70_OXYMA